MTHKNAVLLAGLFHYCVRFAIFISPLKPKCENNVGGVPALLILIGVCLLLVDIEIFPEQYNNQPAVTFRAIEVIVSLLTIEFFIIMIWSRIEIGLIVLIKHILNRGDLYRELGGDTFLTCFIGVIALCFLLWAINISKSKETIAKSVIDILQSIQKFYQKVKALQRGSSPCVPVATTTTALRICVEDLPLRNPCCPIHGDFEISGSSKKPNSRSKKN